MIIRSQDNLTYARDDTEANLNLPGAFKKGFLDIV